jgi:hypothetical protein
MKTTIFDWVATLTLATLLLGILGGTQTGSAFSLAPVAALLNIQLNPYAVTDEPIDELAKRAGENVVTQTQDAIATAANGQTDTRLAACREGSVEAGEPITLANAKTLEQMTVTSLMEVQGFLGQPHCNEQTRWTYLVAGGGVLTANETQDGVEINVRR